MIPENFLQNVASSHGVSELEWDVLRLSIDGKSIKVIAEELDINEGTVRKRLSDIYKKFHIEGRGPVKLARLQQLLVNHYQGLSSEEVTFELGNQKLPQKFVQKQDWGEVSEPLVFYGRKDELSNLSNWVLQDRCRLVALLGMGGIGKTNLAVKLAKGIKDEFEFIICRSLYNQPLPQDFLDDTIKFISRGNERGLLEDINEKISVLIEYLREHRCLLVIDDLETVLRSGDRLGRYEEGYENYGLLLKRLGEAEHQSCLLICSQEKPREISLLENPKGLVKSWQLEGLKIEDAKNILQEQGLTGEKHWETLIRCAQGNPFSLKIVAATIKDLFNGNVAEFTKHNTWVFGDFRTILDEQWYRLSKLEKQMMKILASEGKAVSLLEIKQDIPQKSISELIEALASLKRRALIEINSQEDSDNETSYCLEYLIKKYVRKYHLENSVEAKVG